MGMNIEFQRVLMVGTSDWILGRFELIMRDGIENVTL